MKNKLQLIILCVLLVNTILIASAYFVFVQRYSGGDSMLTYQRELAHDLADYNQRLAVEYEVIEVPAVREALAEYNYETNLASSSDELIRVIFDQGRRVQETIFKESDNKIQEKLLNVINEDRRVKETDEKTHLFLRIEEDAVKVYPDQLLESASIQRINYLLSSDVYQGSQNIDIEIKNGTGKLVIPVTMDEQIQALNDDLSSMRLRLHEIRVQAGLSEMVGPGITLLVYDAGEVMDSASIVHDGDIRDLVNELFSAGAQGISVGGQRLTLTSSIRCSGPLIMINYQQIPTNPVTIQAVGDPDLLVSGLSIIKNEMKARRGLEFEINRSGFIKLPAYNVDE